RAGGLWSGASSPSSANAASTSSSTTTGSRKRGAPCTIRCATAATSAGTRSSESSSSEAPPSSTAESFRLVEPALTTRTRLTRRSVLPGPAAHDRVVFAVLAGVCARAEASILHLLTDVSRPASESRNAVDHVDDEMEPIEVVQHDHVERRGGCPFLLVPANVQVVVVRAAVCQPVDQPRIPVVREDDRSIGREQRVELRIGEPVRMLAL